MKQGPLHFDGPLLVVRRRPRKSLTAAVPSPGESARNWPKLPETGRSYARNWPRLYPRPLGSDQRRGKIWPDLLEAATSN
eukprot:6186721-Alexandrium_andersonii.AAC.1